MLQLLALISANALLNFSSKFNFKISPVFTRLHALTCSCLLPVPRLPHSPDARRDPFPADAETEPVHEQEQTHQQPYH